MILYIRKSLLDKMNSKKLFHSLEAFYFVPQRRCTCPTEKLQVISSVSNIAKTFALFSKHGDRRQKNNSPPKKPQPIKKK